MNAVAAVGQLKNPLYEVGISHPINRKNQQTETNINLPIPKNVIFFRQFKAGETLPINLSIKGNLFSLEASTQTLTFIQDVFIRATREEVTFSQDQVNWHTFMNFFSGELNGRVSQDTHDASPQALVELVANTLGTEE